MPDLTRESVLDALRGVSVPSSDKNLVESQMISHVAVCDGQVKIALSGAGATDDGLRSRCQDVVSGLPGVKRVEVVAAAEYADNSMPGMPEGVKNLVAIASGKGGVGKSTVATNLAVALAQEGARVGLMDLDVWGPNIPIMFGLNTPPRTEGKILIPHEAFGVKVVSLGFFVKDGDPIIWRGPMVHGIIKQFMNEVRWGELDFLLVDLPPGTGDVQISLGQSVPMTGGVIVSTPQNVALQDVRRGVAMFQKVNIPILGIIENMSYYECPSCSHREDLFGHGGARETAKSLGIPFLGEIPLRGAIRSGGDDGKPLTATEPDGEIASKFREAARALVAVVSTVAAQ
ncbi:MAG: Mrp/NBP35 family ATP-binding protein [Planctomycetota bacterium]